MLLTATQIAQLRAVNAEVNAIAYDALPGPNEPFDFWHDDPSPGISYLCRDYTLTKAQRLRESGFDPMLLTVVLCNTEPVGDPPTRGYHAVLAVADGDNSPFILDNRVTDIYRMNAAPYDYQWIDRQVAGTTTFAPIA